MKEDLTALLVVDSANQSEGARGDEALRIRLQSLGYTVTVSDVTKVTTPLALSQSLVIISTLIGTPDLRANFLRLEVPIVVADGAMLETMRMCYKRVEADGEERKGDERTRQNLDEKSRRTHDNESNHSGASKSRSIHICDSAHSLAAALKGKVEVMSEAQEFLRAHPGPEAVTIATLCPPPNGEDEEKEGEAGRDGNARARERDSRATPLMSVLFAYEAGAALCEERRKKADKRRADARREKEDENVEGADPLDLRAPARRIGIFIGSTVAEHLTAEGWALFDAAISWAVGEELKQSAEVFGEEWREIRERRRRQRLILTPPPQKQPRANGRASVGGCAGGREGANGANNGAGANGVVDSDKPSAARLQQPPPENLVGLALSGGGIRSATFCLGLLQGLRGVGMLRAFDYLSTVSGGGYLGGWWSAWLSRSQGDGDGESPYPLLSINDIRDPAGFAARLLREEKASTRGGEESRLLSAYLYGKFSNATRNLLDGAVNDGGYEEEMKKALASELNVVLKECCRKRINLLDEADEIIGNCPFLTDETKDLYKQRAELSSVEVMRLNRIILEDAYAGYFGASIFPPFEKIEPERSDLYFKESVADDGDGSALSGFNGTPEDRREFVEEKAEVAKDLLCAGDDPSHHLRLFANYLTPRKGLLSGDTWRAIAVIMRNLILTWLILVPIIIATVLLGQLYFALRPNSVRDFAEATVTADASATLLAADSVQALAVPGASQASEAFSLTEKERREWETKILRDRVGRVGSKFVEVITRKMEQVVGATVRNAELNARDTEILRDRANFAAWPLGAILALAIVISSVWMFSNNSGSRRNGLLGAAVVWLIVGCLVALYEPGLWAMPSSDWSGAVKYVKGNLPVHYQVLIPLWLALAFVLVAYAMRRPPMERGAARHWQQPNTPGRLDLLRNQAVRVQTALLVAFVFTTFVLFLAGFGHEIVEATIVSWMQSGWGLAWANLHRWVGVLMAAATIAASIFTAIKASPAGGGETGPKEDPTLTSRLLFALAPPSMLLMLVLVAAYGAQCLSQYVANDWKNRLPPLNVAMFAGIYLSLLFALTEIRWRDQKHNQRLLTLTSLPVVLFGIALYFWMSGVNLDPFILTPITPHTMLVVVPLALALFFGVVALLRLAVYERKGEDSHRRRSFRFVVFKDLSYSKRGTREEKRLQDLKLTSLGLLGLSVAAYVVMLLAAWVVIEIFDWTTFQGALSGALGSYVPQSHVGLFCLVAVMLMLCLLCVLLELFRGAGNNRRSLWLLTSTYVVLLALLAITFAPDQNSRFLNYDYNHTVLLVHVIIALFTVALSWVIALGWTADPNVLSIHSFYKDRLVRAYLGASNTKRRRDLKDVSESDENDDLCLAGLRNCQRGGPYHLVNTTLNLAAGRDLAAAQRSSAMFVLSKLNCGSSRTGYRNTAGYMGGRLSLGTAVAASGAAASPSMGSRTPPASLSMLMTLLNVRLGFWAPTPNKKHWRLRFAQLWPFYTMREFLSQTHDLSSYCYLTDGGHFDNTGLYSLVERGCRFIVVADCGADDKPCFADIGDAIRRCRIDFGAEIIFDVDPFRKNNEQKQPTRHFSVGRINYNEKHLRRINWDKQSIEERREGVIVVIKPAVTGDESPDVRQYKLENDKFPQQSTADQWFDESQFESYRKLGFFCAYKIFDEVSKHFPKHGPFKLADIEAIFNTLARRFCTEITAEERRRLSSELWEEAQAVVASARADGVFVHISSGFEYYMRNMIRDAASKLIEMDDSAPAEEAARRNIQLFMQESIKCAEDSPKVLHENYFFAVKLSRSSLFPFFEANADATGDRSNGGGKNGTN